MKPCLIIIIIWVALMLCPPNWLRRIVNGLDRVLGAVKLVGLALFVALQWLVILALAGGAVYGIFKLGIWMFR